MEIPQFNRGKIYKRSQIHKLYGGSSRSGIAPSRKAPAVFIFTGASGEQYGYSDSWDEAGDVFTYTGEGQSGDMRMVSGNAAIANHVIEGRSLHLFGNLPDREARQEDPSLAERGYCRYVDEMQCAGVIEGTGPDKQKNDRKILQFQLVRVPSLSYEEEPATAFLAGSPPTKSASLSELRTRALRAASPDASPHRNARRALYARAGEVVDYALARSGGLCEACGASAPFLRPNGRPYLEVHHIDRLSDGGLDAPHRVASICPNCHRKIHCGDGGASFNDELRLKIENLEALASISQTTPVSRHD